MRVRWLGRVPYREAWALQRAVCRAVRPTTTCCSSSTRTSTRWAPTATSATCWSIRRRSGADLVRVDRGGDVTYHGPGQLVGYPIVTVGPGPHRGPEHVRQVEQVVIDALVALGLPPGDVGRLAGYPGVWVGLDEAAEPPGRAGGPARSPPSACGHRGAGPPTASPST